MITKINNTEHLKTLRGSLDLLIINRSGAVIYAFKQHNLITAAGYDAELGAAGNGVLLKWTDNSGVGSALATDKVLAAVVNQTKGDAVTVTGGATRSSGRQEIALPADWVNCEVNCYLGFVSDDGKDVSNSVYFGSILIIG